MNHNSSVGKVTYFKNMWNIQLSILVGCSIFFILLSYWALTFYIHQTAFNIYFQIKDSVSADLQQGNLTPQLMSVHFKNTIAGDPFVGAIVFNSNTNTVLLKIGSIVQNFDGKITTAPHLIRDGLFSFSIIEQLQKNNPIYLKVDFKSRLLIIFLSLLGVFLIFNLMIILFLLKYKNKNSQIKNEKLLVAAVNSIVRNADSEIESELAIQLPALQLKWPSLKSEWKNDLDQYAQNLAHLRMSKLSSQVSHDIRSPLTALNMIVGVLTNVPEEHRSVIKNAANRITDIANQLLQNSKLQTTHATTIFNESLVSQKPKEEIKSVELLPALVDVLVSEKRIELRDHMNIQIETNFEESYGAFVLLNPTELKKALDLILNRAFKSLIENQGRIVVSIKSYSTKSIIIIRDSGGIILPLTLENLNLKNRSFESENLFQDSDLDLYHAKKIINQLGGDFEIQSQEGLGTEVRLIFVPCQTPNWFVKNLEVNTDQNISILDDDSAIHSVWNERFQGLKLNLKHFTSGEQFKTDFLENKAATSTLFLVDYELLNQKQTGLELIEELKIANLSILVTSRFEDEFIRKKCNDLGVKLIPKTMVTLVPIEFNN